MCGPSQPFTRQLYAAGDAGGGSFAGWQAACTYLLGGKRREMQLVLVMSGWLTSSSPVMPTTRPPASSTTVCVSRHAAARFASVRTPPMPLTEQLFWSRRSVLTSPTMTGTACKLRSAVDAGQKGPSCIGGVCWCANTDCAVEANHAATRRTPPQEHDGRVNMMR